MLRNVFISSCWGKYSLGIHLGSFLFSWSRAFQTVLMFSVTPHPIIYLTVQSRQVTKLSGPRFPYLLNEDIILPFRLVRIIDNSEVICVWLLNMVCDTRRYSVNRDAAKGSAGFSMHGVCPAEGARERWTPACVHQQGCMHQGWEGQLFLIS